MEMIGFMRQLDPLQSKAKPNNSASGLMVLISFSGRFGSIHLDSNWNGVREWPFGRKLEWECGWNPNAAAAAMSILLQRLNGMVSGWGMCCRPGSLDGVMDGLLSSFRPMVAHTVILSRPQRPTIYVATRQINTRP